MHDNEQDQDPLEDVVSEFSRTATNAITGLDRRLDALERGQGRRSGSLTGLIYAGGSDATQLAKALGATSDTFRDVADVLRSGGKVPGHEEVETWTFGKQWFQDASRIQLRAFNAQHGAIRERLDRVQKSDMGGVVDTSGGYAVPTLVGVEVLKLVRDASTIFTRARQIPMTSDTLQFPDETTAVTTNWVAEAGNLTQGEPVFGVKTLVAKKLAGRATFSIELLDDSNVAILPFLQSCFTEKMGGELDAQAMEGAGTVFTGVAAAVGVADCGFTSGTNGVVLKYMSSGATVGGLVNLFCKPGEGYTRNDSIFVCGPAVYAKILGLVDSNGQPIVRLGTVEGAPNNTLFGKPLLVSARFPATTIGAGTVSVGGLYYGPPSALLFGVRRQMTWDVTDQVNWSKYQADARLVGRFAYVVGVPAAWAKQTGIIV